MAGAGAILFVIATILVLLWAYISYENLMITNENAVSTGTPKKLYLEALAGTDAVAPVDNLSLFTLNYGGLLLMGLAAGVLAYMAYLELRGVDSRAWAGASVRGVQSNVMNPNQFMRPPYQQQYGPQQYGPQQYGQPQGPYPQMQ
mgnify:FL=1